jgi:cbb3-type cytochrome oxidase maturation protein
MPVILLLILVSLTLAVGFLVAFIWAVRSGQFEDTCTPSLRILSDDPSPRSFPSDPSSANHKSP